MSRPSQGVDVSEHEVEIDDVVITGPAPGPTVAVFGGVHGDERAGAAAVLELRDALELTCGTLHLVLANPEAAELGVRAVRKNLNRCFGVDNDGLQPEDFLARQLMRLLRDCSALLDLHEHKDGDIGAFAACEPPSFDVARALGAEVVLYGLAEVDPDASDTFMFRQGKVGVCFEAGDYRASLANTERHVLASMRFLRYFGMIDQAGVDACSVSASEPQFIRVTRAIKKSSDAFQMTRSWKMFDRLDESVVIAVDGARTYVGRAGEIMLFPRPQNAVGANACLIGEIVQSH